jgi:hypothetical protein
MSHADGQGTIRIPDDLPAPLTFRDKIVLFEQGLKELPGALGKNPFPLEHLFAQGLYIRKIVVPAQTLTVTMIHRFSHPLFLLQGELSILEEWGARRVKAPDFFMMKLFL